MDNVGIFVDVQNIYYTTRQIFGRQFDYRTLWQHLSSEHNIAVAKAYATERGDEGQKKFQSALRHIGFDVRLKPFIQRRDGSAKGDWDVGITIDVLQHAAPLDRIVLLTGDGDFDLLIDAVIREHDIEVDVYGVAELSAGSLKRAASHFYPINEGLLL